MKTLSVLLYHLVTHSYSAGIRLAALWNPKARLWVEGRRDIFKRVIAWRAAQPKEAKVVWMHCASLGEFEQGRPVLEAVKAAYPGVRMFLTFFSPSGYEVRKTYAGADGVFYLPADTAGNASLFIGSLRPDLVLWVKYEYWYHYLSALQARQTPLLLISAIFRDSQPFFRWYGSAWRKMLSFFTAIFVQNTRSAELLKYEGINLNSAITGDTRFDRVLAAAESPSELPDVILAFCGEHPTIVAGSTWEEDEELLVHYAAVHPDMRFLIAPHEVHPVRIREVQKLFPKAVLFSAGSAHADSRVMIIDNIGMLSSLYATATICYIGGGFNSSGIHNILEAAVHGKPVVFGPEYEKFQEAVRLVEKGGAFSVEHAVGLETLLDKLFKDAEFRKNAGEISRRFVVEHAGATVGIMNYIQEKRLLTN